MLQQHHIIPRFLDGPDSEENTTTLCANCHQAVEQMYDQKFYQDIKEKFSEKIAESVLDFHEHCLNEVDCGGRVEERKMYQMYLRYCENRDIRPLMRKEFDQQMRSKITEPMQILETSTKRRTYYRGIRPTGDL
jgi:phage/plasmid-associated DNA primase